MLLLTLLASCTGQGWKRVSERDMRRMLPEFAMLSTGMEQRGTPDSIRQATYEAFLSDYGYTLTDWDSSMRWYAVEQLDLLHDIYRQATDSLARLEAQLQGRQDSVVTYQEYIRKRYEGQLDSLNMLREGERVYFPGELINRSFTFTPSSPYSEGQILNLSTSVQGLQPADSVLMLELCMQTSDSLLVRSSLRVFPHQGNTRLTMGVPTGKSVVRVFGSLRGVLPRRTSMPFVLCDSLRLIRLPSGNAGLPTTESPEANAIPQADSTAQPVSESVPEAEDQEL